MPSPVSVVIPCYAQAHFVRDAIESALSQSHPAQQIIVVDDGSPDDVWEAVRPYPSVTYLRQENLGLGAARNAGLARCTSDLVVFLDADDRLLPHALQVGADALDGRPDCGLVWGLRYLINESGERLTVTPALPPPNAGYVDMLAENLVGPPAGVMFRRSALERVGGFWTLRLPSEDYDQYLRIVRSFPIFCHGVHVVEYRLHAGNMSSNAEQMVAGCLEVLDRQAALGDPNPIVRKAITRARRRLLQDYDRETRLQALKRDVDERRWGRVPGAAATLLGTHPATLPILARALVKKVRGAWVAADSTSASQ